MQFSSKQVVARRFKNFRGPTEVMTACYNANLLRRITFFQFCIADHLNDWQRPYGLIGGQGPLFLGSWFASYFTSFTHICTVFYELYANLHRILRGLRTFAPYFMSFTQICIVFYELYAHLQRVLRALRKFAPCFTRFTQICIVFFELYTNLHRILRALRKFAPYFTRCTQICTVFYEVYAHL